MGKFYTLLTHVHSAAGPVIMLLYPLYASVMAIESPSKEDDEQWLAYWILYSFLTLSEIVLQPLLEWIPIWYTVKLALVAWLVLPQFRGAAFIYEKFVREKIRQYVPRIRNTLLLSMARARSSDPVHHQLTTYYSRQNTWPKISKLIARLV